MRIGPTIPSVSVRPAGIARLVVITCGLSAALHVSSAGISELEFRPDWTALHRMNTLVHLDAVLAGR